MNKMTKVIERSNRYGGTVAGSKPKKIGKIQGGFLSSYINKLFTVHCLLLLQTFRTTTYNSFKYKNTYVKCSSALKSSRATKQLVNGALLDLIDHDITNCGLSHGHGLGGSGLGAAVSVHCVGGGGDGGGAPLTW